jgi:hypothetical protein
VKTLWFGQISLKRGMLQQPGIGVFVEPLQFRIDQPDVRNTPAAIIFQAMSQSAITIVRGNDFDYDIGRAGCVTAFRPCVAIHSKVNRPKAEGLDLHTKFGHEDESESAH